MKDRELLLVEKCKNGDVNAFEELIKEYKKTAYNLAYRYVNNVQDAEDLSQEAIIKAFRSIKTFNADASFNTWLFRIVVNTCLDFKKKKSLNTVSMDEKYNNDFTEYKKQYEDKSTGPEELAVEKEENDYLMYLINNMDENLKTVIILRDINNFSYEEISQILSCSIGTVKSRISRGRDKLRQQINSSKIIMSGG